MTISVIIPSYNAARLLPNAVDSVLRQTRPADEVIVVDDGSTDDTAEVCRGLDRRVRYIRRENGGLSAARNTGLAASTGEWFLSLDADDVLYPQALQALSEKADSCEAGVVYGYVLQRREPAVETRIASQAYAVGLPPDPARAQFWWTAINTAGCALVRRSLNDDVGGFDEHFRQVEDCEYWLRCGVISPFAHCDQIVLDKSYSPSSLGQNVEGSTWFRLQLQLKFLLWCEDRNIDTTFLNVSKADLINHALTRIYRQRTWSLLGPVLEQARRQNALTLRYWIALAHYGLRRSLGRNSSPSTRIKEVYRNWMTDKNSASARS
jgi:glycosyltransferase involved in cell wall biosynthesis